jgi:hypothetical protein
MKISIGFDKAIGNGDVSCMTVKRGAIIEVCLYGKEAEVIHELLRSAERVSINRPFAQQPASICPACKRYPKADCGFYCDVPVAQQPVRLGRKKNFDILPEKCPKCGERLIHNNTGIECGAMRCGYHAGGEQYSQPTMRESRLQKVGALLRHARSLCSVRYQAYQYVKEGEPGYAAAGDLAMEATQHIRKIDEVIRQAEDMLPATNEIGADQP